MTITFGDQVVTGKFHNILLSCICILVVFVPFFSFLVIFLEESFFIPGESEKTPCV